MVYWRLITFKTDTKNQEEWVMVFHYGKLFSAAWITSHELRPNFLREILSYLTTYFHLLIYLHSNFSRDAWSTQLWKQWFYHYFTLYAPSVSQKLWIIIKLCHFFNGYGCVLLIYFSINIYLIFELFYRYNLLQMSDKCFDKHCSIKIKRQFFLLLKVQN